MSTDTDARANDSAAAPVSGSILTGKAVVRPRKFTDEVRGAILGALRTGAPIVTAARVAGISHETFYQWMRAGREQESGELHDFAAECDRIIGETDVEMHGHITEQARHDWRAAAWHLERKDGSRYTREQLVELRDICMSAAREVYRDARAESDGGDGLPDEGEFMRRVSARAREISDARAGGR